MQPPFILASIPGSTPVHTILHIDTSETFRKILERTFTDAGFVYLGAESRSEAETILSNNPDIRLIITALELGDSSGEDFLRFLGSGENKDVPVVVITSHDSIEARNRLFSMGAVDFIPKSAGADRLLEHVKITYVERLKQEDAVRKALKSMRIAVLDDSRTELNLIRQIFELHGIQNVSYFIDETELLEAEPFSLYLVDVVLPKFSGEQVIMQLKRKKREAMVIAISAIDHYKTVSNVILSGADDYIIKPFNTSIFMARMQAAARSWLQVQELHSQRIKLEATNRKLQELVVQDSLTGLFNHGHSYERLENETRLSKRYKRPLSLFMLDIDHFKSINDRFGHQKGDMILREVADQIRKNFRDVDIKGRYGGEEFMIILPETNLENAVKCAERMRHEIENLTFDVPDLKMTVSGGMVEYVDGDTAASMIRKADALLYDAKKSGRNRILF